MKRIQKDRIIKDLEKKMVFLIGPRQVGKTHLAKIISSEYDNSLYLNWDEIQDQEIILNKNWLDDTDLLVLDELHKMPNWKNYLKGLFDKKDPGLRILITGSARLDIFNNIGDSLAGRYFCHHLMPLSPSELKQLGYKVDLRKFMTRGGFPEPFLAESNVEAERWRLQYIDSLINIDVLSFDSIQNLGAIRTIFNILRSCVGSPVSYNSISRDVGVSPNTVKKYINVLESLYIVFKVTPFSKNIARSILKEPKIFFFDSALVKETKENNGAKFENLIAVNLLKHVYAKRDYEGKNYNLNYLRNKDQREVDFLLANENCPEQIIEVKYANDSLSSNLRFFAKEYNLNASQVVFKPKNPRKVDGIPIVDAMRFLISLVI
jgi:uncharacterized protein